MKTFKEFFTETGPITIENDEFESWNDFIKSIVKAYKKSIILERHS